MKSAKWIPLEKIKPDPSQPRKNFKSGSIAELAQSISEYGIRQPIVVEYDNDKDSFRIVSGERRFRAAKMLDLKVMPCIVQDNATNTLRFAQQLIENIHREDFSPIDKARALLEYKTLLGKDVPWSDVEKKLGIGETRRKQFISLLNLPKEIQSEIVTLGNKASKNQITEKHARALLALNKQPNEQTELFDMIRNGKNSISGDEAIEKAKEMKGEEKGRLFKVSYQSVEELIDKLERAIQKLKKIKAGVT
jgi:ParB family chromosome partitioning protein